MNDPDRQNAVPQGGRRRLSDLQQSRAAQRGVAGNVGGGVRLFSRTSRTTRRSASSCSPAPAARPSCRAPTFPSSRSERSSKEAVDRYNAAVDQANTAVYDFPEADHRHDPRLLHRRRRRVWRLCCDCASAPTIRSSACRRPSSASATALTASRSWSIWSAHPSPRKSSSPRGSSPRRGAQMMGLVNRVLPDAELEKYVKDYAETISGNAPLTVELRQIYRRRSGERREQAQSQDAAPSWWRNASPATTI